MRARNSRIAAIDLFCGAGGLTHGLIRAGLPVVAGIDLDLNCKFPFEANNDAVFIHGNVAGVDADALRSTYPEGAARVLVGCAPCQEFSRYSRREDRRGTQSQKWALLGQFAKLVEQVRPAAVSMENVPELSCHPVFGEFVETLQASGYHVTYSNVYCPDYGIPQHRTRLVLFASPVGPITLIPPTHPPGRYRTVEHAISKLRPLSRGQVDAKDPLHRACTLSDLNYTRIRASRQGGCWREWPKHLIARCHQAASGKTYPSVYGRMEWDKPAPTITTQFFGFGNGRFGHPEQDRAISLREGSILQSFPRTYKFSQKTEDICFSVMGRLIGNAVPVRLGEVIGKSILNHMAQSNG